MTRTMTVDVGSELRQYVENLVTTGDYKSNSEVLRESLRLLREKQAMLKFQQLRNLIEEGKLSGEPVLWKKEDFLKKMKDEIDEKR